MEDFNKFLEELIYCLKEEVQLKDKHISTVSDSELKAILSKEKCLLERRIVLFEKDLEK